MNSMCTDKLAKLYLCALQKITKSSCVKTRENTGKQIDKLYYWNFWNSGIGPLLLNLNFQFPSDLPLFSLTCIREHITRHQKRYFLCSYIILNPSINVLNESCAQETLGSVVISTLKYTN